MWFWLSIEACATISTPVFLILPLIHVSQFQSIHNKVKGGEGMKDMESCEK